MSLWNGDRPSKWPIYTGVGLIVLAFVTGLLLLTGEDPGEGAATRTSTSSSVGPDGSDDREGRPLLEVVSWGRASGQLAVVVRNTSPSYIQHARIRISAYDEDDRMVLSTAGTVTDVCCTVVGLPRGEEYGVFAEMPAAASDPAAVEVAVVSAETRRAAAADTRVAVGGLGLQHYDDDTVATATLTARRPVSGYVVAQAILVDRRGDTAQVISGRYYCFEPGRPRQVRLRLFHEVPPDLRLDRVVAYPLPPGVPPYVRRDCR